MVLRNRREYEITVNTDPDFDMEYINYLVPECPSPDPDLKYFAKLFLPDGKLVIKLVVFDGKDRFNRNVMKAHNLILSGEEYRKEYLTKGLPYYITPLVDGRITNTSDDVLQPEDFRIPDISKIKPVNMLYDLFCTKKVSLYMETYQPDMTMMLFSVLDYALPSEVNDQISILSYIPETMVDQENNAEIAFYHVSKPVIDGKKTARSLAENDFLESFVNSLTDPFKRKQHQRELMSGSIENSIAAKFKKNFHVSKDGDVHPMAPKKSLFTLLKDKLKSDTNKG
ncbi:MAG: hypothetical protein ACFFD4_31545 [Candidatus Odinarchaeota archaeon]